MAHCHVREPKTGKGSRKVEYYKEVVDRVRASGTDVIINLTGGMGGDLEINDTDPTQARPEQRHGKRARAACACRGAVAGDLQLDCGSLNFGDGELIFVSTPKQLRTGAKRIQELGVKPELEVFELGHLWFAKQMLKEGLLDAPPLFQICLGIPWGAPADTSTMKTFVDQMPAGANWAGFGIGRMQMPMVAQAAILGGNCRVGLEDNIWLDKGVHASNGSLVHRAVEILNRLGARVLTPEEGRKKLGLKKRH